MLVWERCARVIKRDNLELVECWTTFEEEGSLCFPTAYCYYPRICWLNWRWYQVRPTFITLAWQPWQLALPGFQVCSGDRALEARDESLLTLLPRVVGYSQADVARQQFGWVGSDVAAQATPAVTSSQWGCLGDSGWYLVVWGRLRATLVTACGYLPERETQSESVRLIANTNVVTSILKLKTVAI